MGFFEVSTSGSSINVGTCAAVMNSALFRNLTKSYIQQLDETTTLSTSLIMFVLAALFFNLNLFSSLSDASAILNPKVRLVLSSALSLFLPVMSYLFSEAKNAPHDSTDDELNLRARLILIWMLLVELLRKKVEEIHMHKQGYSGTMERVGRVIWLGSLVFFNLQGASKRSMFGILWLLCATRLVQRIVLTEVGRRSLAYGKNAPLIASYMEQLLLEDDQQENRVQTGDRDELLKRCKYVVMEEENLVLHAIPGDYRLRTDAAATVGKIWELARTDDLLSPLDGDQVLRQLCLSFALFKLLRRRFEHLAPAMTAAETRSYRELIFKGMQQQSDKGAGMVLFRLTSNELNFLSEYYHSVVPVVPVVLSSPFFLLANYFLLPLVVFVLCLVIIVLCTNGDVAFAWESIRDDNYITFFGVTTTMTGCLSNILTSPFLFFSFIDFSITSLLLLMVVYEELWEFFVLLLSDWFTVSLLCKYAVKPKWKDSRVFRWSIRCILGARGTMNRPDISFNQLSVLNFCWLAMPVSLSLPVTLPVIPLPTIAVPDQVKRSIMAYLASKLHDLDGNPTALMLSKGRLALTVGNHEDLLPFCEGDGIAEVILTWHIATSLLEVMYPITSEENRVVGTSLSKYCAYLVAFHPELLPDNQDSTELVLQAMIQELIRFLGFWRCYLPTPWCGDTWYDKIMDVTATAYAKQQQPSSSTPAPGTLPVVQRGATLARKLKEKGDAQGHGEGVWKLLADLWVELVVYVAPSSDDGCVAGHKNMLAKGGEFITVLWALATHTGISRPSDEPPREAIPIEREGVSCV